MTSKNSYMKVLDVRISESITVVTNFFCRVVSDPSHSNYGRHLSAAEVNELVKPSEESKASVEGWLLDHNIHQFSYSPAEDWITVSLPVIVVEHLLDTKYHMFYHEDDKEVVIRTLEWSIPLHLHDCIDAIQPTNSFLRPKTQDRHRGPPPPEWEVAGQFPTHEELEEEDLLDHGHLDIPDIKDLPSNPTAAEACNRLAISPHCLRTLYGSLNYVPQVPGKNKIALVNFGGNVNNRSDISLFLERYRPDAVAAYTFQTEIVADGDDQQTPDTPEQLKQWKGFEGALDAQTILGVSYPTPMIAYNVGGKPPFKASNFTPSNSNEPYLTWLQYMLAQPTLPQVISISYADEEQAVPYSYAKRVCEGFAQLGARGVSVVVSSGDDGVGRDGHCFSNYGNKKPQWLPTFPASCPFVTAAGGTRYIEPGIEIAGFDRRWDFVTGGGFSNHFPRPRYQDQAVSAYVRGLGGNFVGEGLYNKGGRGVPDISAQAYHYVIIFNGLARLGGGTSASTPTAASIISLVNDALMAEGRPPLGFLNPWIYSKGFQAFNDVTIGSAPGCNTTGFPAVKGWDAATGFGTPVSTQKKCST
jgi:tripeptidyl-peptidase I